MRTSALVTFLILTICLAALTGASAATAKDGDLYLPFIADLGDSTPKPTATATETGVPPTETPTVTPTITLTPLPTTDPGANNVRILEILYDPPGSDAEGERVTLGNLGGTAVNMTGWKLIDDADTTFTFPVFTLQPGAKVNVWVRSGTNTATDLYWNRNSAIWNNDGDTATLLNADGNVIDACTYAGGGSLATCE